MGVSGLAHKCPLDWGRGALVTITGQRNVNILNQDHTVLTLAAGQESRVHFLKNATGRQVSRFPFYDQLLLLLYTTWKKLTLIKDPLNSIDMITLYPWQ